MQRSNKFEIISFTADRYRYFPVSMNREKFMDDSWISQADIEIPMGKSRYGGSVVDLPPEYQYPKKMRFVAQLDLSEFAPFDSNGLLPRVGQLIFFADIRNDKVKVIYSNIATNRLVRIVKDHEDNFFYGVLIDKIYKNYETFEERFMQTSDKSYTGYIDAERKLWDYSSGSKKSKLFGIFTHCQFEQEKIEEITYSDKVVLLQIGESGFNDEGVFSVLIKKYDLLNKNFGGCECYWAQS